MKPVYILDKTLTSDDRARLEMLLKGRGYEMILMEVKD
jgi:hypothetical protein